MAVLIVIPVLITVFIIYRRWLHPLAQFPGPFVASISGLYQTYWNFQPNFPDNFVRLHEKYGPIVRYSPNGLIFNDAELLSIAYGRRADKSDFFAPNFDTHSTFTRKFYEEHVASKKTIATAYSYLNLKLFEARIDKLIISWLGLLAKSTHEQGTTDFLEHASWLTFDVTSQLACGKPIGFIEAGTDVRDLIHNKNLCFRWINFLAIQDNFSWYIRNTRLGRWLFMARPTDKSGVGVLMRERDRIVESVFDDDGNIKKNSLVEGSLLSTFLSAKNDDESQMSFTDTKAEILFALLAGSSVTPSALWTMVFLISRDSEVKEALYQELISAERTAQIPSKQSIISDEQAKKLPYLHACIQESFRFAPTLSQLPRYSPRGTGLRIHGQYVPPGFSVSTSPWVIGRNKTLFGIDADIYRPERWTEASPGQVRKWNRNGFHFGYGGRKCVAKPFALIQIYKVIAEIFRRFDVQVDGPTHGTSAGKASTKQFRFILRPSDDD
ncbi:hypothetical protein PENPOL_c021G03699 [Penicillium polonicum]|uniref:Cytochrome P450 n=1 Tax=Penicillium polonicum TaxID=60169 RepID=A0A1V6N7T0_PENPO|nr:hypothetical protein PENPOL_c021G03699 [Penicillium polonicum]